MAKSFLGANTDGVDMILRGQNSLFVGKAPHKVSNTFQRYEDNNPLNAVAWNNILQFEPPNASDLIGKCWLIVNTAACTSSGATGSNPRFVDAIGYLAYRTVEVMHGSNPLQRFSGLDCYIHDVTSLRTEDTYSEAAGVGLSAATRATNAGLSAYEFICPLSLLFWTGKPANYLPYNIEVMRTKLTILVTLQPIANVMETDGSTLVQSINSAVLRVQNIHLMADERAALRAEIAQPNLALNTKGFARLVTLHQSLPDYTLTATTAEQEVKLQNIRQPVKELIYAVRDPSTLSDGTINAANTDIAFQAVTAHRLAAFNENIHPRYSAKFNNIIMNEGHSAPLGHNLFCSSFSYAPESQEQFGYMNVSSLSAPTLYVELANTAHTNLHIVAPSHAIYYIVGGEVRMLYA